MSTVDLVVLVLLALAMFRGWRKGMLSQVFELGGGFLGLIAGIALGPRIAGWVTDRPGTAGALVSLFVVFALVSIGQAAGYVIGHRSSSAIREHRFGVVDSVLGSGFGALVTLTAFWLVGSLLVKGPTPEIARSFQRSTILKAVNKVMPEPPNVLAYLQHYLNTSGFPQVFAGFPRPVGPPVDLPSDREVRRAVKAAQASTVRIVAPACGGTQLGSGWIAAEGTIVTNAHVVSGADSVTVQDAAGEHEAMVVLFDPQTDIAVLHTSGLVGPVLELDTQRYERGEPGATLGYPGSSEGELVWHRAAVQDTFEAVGKDIYGRRDVSRDVYELRSRVRQGDSGGPFVLPTGQVAGVVFAASTTDHGVGYALTGAEVSDEVAAGANRTEPVSTGNCTR